MNAAKMTSDLDIWRSANLHVNRRRSGQGCRDVTAGYIIHSVERLRDPMQRITDQIRALSTPREIEQEVPLDRSPTTRAAEGLGQRAQ